MTSATVRGLAFLAAAVVSLALALGGVASAHTLSPTWGPGSGSGSEGNCSGGQAAGSGSILGGALSASFTVCKHGTDPHAVSGFFHAMGTPPSNILLAPQGPVTCAAFRGDEVSFLYPLAAGSQPPLPPNATAILIYAKAGGPGVGKVGFTGPLPTAVFGGNCDFSSLEGTAAQADAQPLSSGSVSVTGPRN
jgi:hypothetical protein